MSTFNTTETTPVSLLGLLRASGERDLGRGIRRLAELAVQAHRFQGTQADGLLGWASRETGVDTDTTDAPTGTQGSAPRLVVVQPDAEPVVKEYDR